MKSEHQFVVLFVKAWTACQLTAALGAMSAETVKSSKRMDAKVACDTPRERHASTRSHRSLRLQIKAGCPAFEDGCKTA